MALIDDPNAIPEPVIDELAKSLRADLEETVEMVDEPRGRVIDPASLVTARELLASARAVLDRTGPRTRTERAAEVNLAYSTMVAVIDLVKSHTDAPRVPPPRSRRTE